LGGLGAQKQRNNGEASGDDGFGSFHVGSP
jgi:hypothetical protein